MTLGGKKQTAVNMTAEDTTRFLGLALDYDGTLAQNGRIGASTLAALNRVRESTRKLILVTGRELDDLLTICPQIRLFHSVVAENGALLYQPANGEIRMLAAPPLPGFVRSLQERGVTPLSIGRAIVATRYPHQGTVRQVIAEMGLALQVILNKGAVMVVPATVDKGTGLRIALKDLGLAAAHVVGVGDAENDVAFLSICGFSVAVANALPALKESADLTTRQENGAGVVEIFDKIMANNLVKAEN